MAKPEEQKAAAEPDDSATLREVGRLLAQAIAIRGLTDRKLAQVAGLSRANIRFARKGSNITILTLLKLSRALEIRSIDIGSLTFGSAEVTDDTAAAVAEKIESAVADLMAAVAILRNRRNESAEVRRMDRDDRDTNAAELVRDVMFNAKRLGPDGLAALDEALHSLVVSALHDATTPSRQRANRGEHQPK